MKSATSKSSCNSNCNNSNCHCKPNKCDNCICPPGPQDPQGEPGPQLISQPIATFLVNAPNINGTTVPQSSSIIGWRPSIGVINSSSISVDSTTGIFTLQQAGVYSITAFVSVKPGSGVVNGVANELKYSFVIVNTVPSPTSPGLSLTGLTTSTTSGGVLGGTLTAYYPANSSFRIINSSGGDVAIVNGGSSGTAASISIYRLADQQSL